jgi:glycerol-3-phosphate cytidylyltransferase
MGCEMQLGYTTGVFDLFHIGHLNLLKNARNLCDKLIVGVSTDELVKEAKNKTPVIPFTERMEVLSSCRYVDAVISQESRDKFLAWEKIKFDVLFVGDDWFQQDSWKVLESKFTAVGVRIIYLPYTKTTSSTLINKIIDKLIEG